MKPKKKSRKTSKKKSPKKKLISIPGPSGRSSKKEFHERLAQAIKTEDDPSDKELASQPERVIKKRRLYNMEQLQAAYYAVKDSSISVNAAAKQYGVPLTTLRDRVDGRISMDTTRPGPPQLLAQEEEAEIAHFLHTMARYGYRYTRLELGEIATDQAVEKGKKNPRSNGLTTKWVDNFVSRWPSTRQLSCRYKNKGDAEHTVRTYFDEIKKIIDCYKLLEKSDRIFNIMEIGLDTNHGTLPNATGKSGHQFKTENVSHTTMIACVSVTGQVMAPFFIFQAARLRPEMMRGVSSNCNAAVSDTGRCTPRIFRRYLNEHFLPQTQRKRDSDPLLVLMDGARSHVFVGLAEWGKANNVIFSFVPAHTTHLLQPLEVECAERIQRKYENICRRYMKVGGDPFISRNGVAELACNAYLKVLNRQAIVHSFRKAGVYPDVVSDESEPEADDDAPHESFKAAYLKSEDNLSDKDEVVYTGDLVVGHNEEVTEEEVVISTQEVLLPEEESMPSAQQVQQHEEELVISPGRQLLMQQAGEMVMVPEGHIVIHDGEIYLNNTDATFSQLTSLKFVSEEETSRVGCASVDLSKVSPLKQCVTNDGKMIDTITVASSAVLHDSEFSSVIDQDSLSLISPDAEHKLHHHSHHLSPSDNSSSSNNSIFSSSMEDAGLDLKPAQESGLDISSSSSSSASPGSSSKGRQINIGLF